MKYKIPRICMYCEKDLGFLETDEFVLPEETCKECGAKPRTRCFDFQ